MSSGYSSSHRSAHVPRKLTPESSPVSARPPLAEDAGVWRSRRMMDDTDEQPRTSELDALTSAVDDLVLPTLQLQDA